ncbi:glycoside hydrolase family 5 protein [Serendipita vermifera MAFF 305830]|uniref:cellulase n=1 Tax=Serendipita vermifera MAFF 305830 TaxID=933852 RepID=A0A0C2WEJ4_SERVB|nr:glycoside hydrolase family 5 protein [Serendipita vermifera MAFF 305830]
MKFSVALAALATLVSSVQAVAEWGQCGGINYTGSTSCDSGLTCVVINSYYYQCQKGASGATTTQGGSSTTTTTTTTTTGTSGSCSGATKFKYFGVNQSSAEFGSGKIPGVLGTDYTWPSPSSVDYFIGKGMKTFRIAFLMERLAPPSSGMAGAFDATYLAGLKTIASYVTSKGGYAFIEPHNYARYNGAVITDYSAFQTFWKNLATQFKSDGNIVFDLMNEPHDIAATAAASLMQAGVNGVRASGATQTIMVEGTSWTGAWTWVSSGNGDAFKSLTDPQNNVVFEMHQYLDSDSSGTSATCVSTSIGVERLTAASNWLKANNKKGMLGEIGAGSNDVCIAAVKNALCHLQQQGGAWVGALWWAAGPWWGTYFQSIEPPSGASISRILPEALLPFL